MTHFQTSTTDCYPLHLVSNLMQSLAHNRFYRYQSYKQHHSQQIGVASHGRHYRSNISSQYYLDESHYQLFYMLLDRNNNMNLHRFAHHLSEHHF